MYWFLPGVLKYCLCPHVLMPERRFQVDHVFQKSTLRRNPVGSVRFQKCVLWGLDDESLGPGLRHGR